MGLLDSLLGAAQQSMGGGAQASQGAGGVDWMSLILGLLNSQGGAQGGAGGGGLAAVLGSLTGGGGAAAGGLGGLAGGLGTLMQQLQGAGLGEQVQSWVSNGANLPVSGDQLGAALGGDVLERLAGQAGVSTSEASEQLSQWLPQVVDKLTPSGQLPAAGADLSGVLGQLLGGQR